MEGESCEPDEQREAGREEKREEKPEGAAEGGGVTIRLSHRCSARSSCRILFPSVSLSLSPPLSRSPSPLLWWSAGSPSPRRSPSPSLTCVRSLPLSFSLSPLSLCVLLRRSRANEIHLEALRGFRLRGVAAVQRSSESAMKEPMGKKKKQTVQGLMSSLRPHSSR